MRTGTFTCEICGQTFEQKSKLERHLATSHPERAPSAGDIEHALKGVDFPQTRQGLIEAASANAASPETVSILREFPDQEYRDSAEVARALGEVRSHQHKPSRQPSKLGGERAMEAMSAARVASLFSGIDFPASAADLKKHARGKANEEELAVLERFHSGTYRDMSDVAKELGRVT